MHWFFFHRSLRRTLLLYNVIEQREVQSHNVRHCEERSNLFTVYSDCFNFISTDCFGGLAMKHVAFVYFALLNYNPNVHECDARKASFMFCCPAQKIPNYFHLTVSLAYVPAFVFFCLLLQPDLSS